MKRLLLISALLLFTSNTWAYSETDLAKLKDLNSCKGCDLSGANLRGAYLVGADLRGAYLLGTDLTDANLVGANLRGADLTDANLTDVDLRFARLDDAKYCKTKMPWGERNDHCEE